MATAKDRRQSGYVTPQPTVPIKYLDLYGFEITPFYDEWENYRDGQRDDYKDFKLIKESHSYKWRDKAKRIDANRKQRRLLHIRKARKLKRRAIFSF